ncbi:phytoene desaturase family protein [Cryobacterium psychrophilum]|uniref:phytoene desaturase family protein n=1 Tax=Cryobacterium psychrophilum TaxID=41988 RepID=UPI0010E0580A|nr:phytoene desaturase family protein [Cryobacterium psychrophilum]TDW29664.1 phytoene desaturase [Cryobacterium psychrophilum]
MSDKKTAVVIGGGIAGLATASLLAREGLNVTLLEARSELGGRAGSWERDGFRFDTGPSWYLMPEVFDHFFRLLGTSSDEQLTLTRLDPGYRVFFEKHSDSVDIAADRATNLRTFERIEPGAAAALEKYLDSARDTYIVAVRRFLYSTFASFRTLLVPDVLTRTVRLARLLLQPLDRFVARAFTDNRLRQILGYPAVFLGSAPSMTPSLYHLMSHLDLEDGVYYPDGGFTEVIEAIARLAGNEGVDIVTGARATAISTSVTRGRTTVTGVRYTDSTGVARHANADIVVSTADLHHTETELLPEALRTYPEKWWEKKIAGPGAVLVYLGVRGTLPPLAHHSLFFTEDWAENFGRIFAQPTSVPDPASIYVCRPSATDGAVAPAGHENLFVLVPVPADPTIGGGGVNGEGDAMVEAVADTVIEQIADWAGIPDLAERIVLRRTVGPADFERDLNSWKGSALGPAHTLRQSAFLRGKNVSAKVDGLFYSGGTTVPGIGLPMCLISAELVIKRLRGDTSTPALPEPL